MAYQVTKFDNTGRQIGDLGQFATIIGARNAMIEDAGREPVELPFHCPEIRVVEGWFIGKTEYNIIQAR